MQLLSPVLVRPGLTWDTDLASTPPAIVTIAIVTIAVVTIALLNGSFDMIWSGSSLLLFGFACWEIVDFTKFYQRNIFINSFVQREINDIIGLTAKEIKLS